LILRPGSRWRSVVGDAEIVVIRAPEDDVALECAGAAMVPIETTDAASGAGGESDQPVLLGKRYELTSPAVEVLCSKPGPGPLAVGGEALAEKGAKPLPSSD
jgi:hypothetical protein